RAARTGSGQPRLAVARDPGPDRIRCRNPRQLARQPRRAAPVRKCRAGSARRTAPRAQGSGAGGKQRAILVELPDLRPVRLTERHRAALSAPHAAQPSARCRHSELASKSPKGLLRMLSCIILIATGFWLLPPVTPK